MLPYRRPRTDPHSVPETRISSVHIIGSRTLGGAENFYLRLISALHEAGQPVVAVNPPGSDVGRALAAGIGQHPVAMRSVFDPIARWRIGHYVRRQRPAIVQTYMGRATRLTHIRPGRGTVHVARLGGFYNPKGYRHAHAWIGNTRGICDYLLEHGFPPQRVFHIGNFVEPVPATAPDRLRSLRNELRLPPDARVVLGMGRLHPNKDFGTLLEAFAQLHHRPEHGHLHLVIVGDGPAREALHVRARQLGLSERLHWTGWRTAPHAYFHLADVFVCPSRHEPLGNVILEAWAHHTPVISTRTHGAEELITDGVDGVLVPTERAEALAEKIADLLAMTSTQRQDLIDHGSRTLSENHSKAAVLKRYLAVYGQLAAEAT